MADLRTDLKDDLASEQEACPALQSTLGDNALLRQELSRRLAELHAIRAALVRAEAQTRAIIDAAQEGIVLFDTNGVVQEFNPQAAAIFGWPPVEAVGRKLGKAQAPIRVAVMGRTRGLPLFDSLAVLGREETRRRLAAALSRLAPPG